MVRDWDWVPKALNELEAERKEFSNLFHNEWIEGGWDENGQPILPDNMPEFIWYIYESSTTKVSRFRESTLSCSRKTSISTLLRTVSYYMKETDSRMARWFWCPISDVPPTIESSKEVL